MRIALVVHAFPPGLFGGTETSVQALAEALCDAGHTPIVIAGADNWSRGASVTHTEQGGISVYFIQRADPYYGHWHKSLDAESGRAIEAILERERPDVVHLHHWIRLSKDVVRRAVGLGIPTVVTLHDYSTTCLIHHRVRPATKSFCEERVAPNPCLDCARGHYLATPWVDAADERAFLDQDQAQTRAELEAANTVTCLSSEQARQLHAYLELTEAPKIIPPFLRHGAYRTRDRSHRRSDEPISLVTWGSIHPLKGLDVLVDAVRLATESGVDVELDISGSESDEDYATRLRQRAEGLPIRFRGPFDDLNALASTRADVFVSGTRARETWGLVADEALTLGLPLLLPKAGAFVERFASSPAAWLYRSGDACALAEEIERLRSSPDDLNAATRATKDAFAELPSEAACIDSWTLLYEQAIRAGASGRRSARLSADELRTQRERWDQGFSAAYPTR